MREIFSEEVESCRIVQGAFRSERGDRFGLFYMPVPPHSYAVVMVAPGDEIPTPDVAIAKAAGEEIEPTGWDHVSVHLRTRIRKGRKRLERMETPSWDVMCQLKDLFFDSEELVVQFHPPESEYVNNHPHCLHLWRAVDGHMQLPPAVLTGTPTGK